jgi:hypothetical protein
VEEFQTFWIQFASQLGHAGDVAAGSSETRHQAKLDWIAQAGANNGDLGRCSLGGFCRCIARGKEKVDSILHQLASGSGQGGDISLGKADADVKLLMLVVTQGQ